MNMSAPLARGVILLSIVMVNRTSSAQAVKIAAGGPPFPAIPQNVTYAGNCPAGKYEMNISHDEKHVQIIVPGVRLPLDFTDSRFGKTLLTRPLIGRFLFMCGTDTLHVHFWGFEVGKNKLPKSVGYFLTLANEGRVEYDTGLEDVALESMRTNLDSH